MQLTPGSPFGVYQIIEPLGRGGMASVYKAYEPSLDRYVALKVLPQEFLHEETFAARFQREAKVVAKLEHPNIIPIFSFGIEGGIPWMAMRLIAGGSLSAFLKKGSFGLERSVAVIRAVADALTYAHAQGVVHRDVKPQNILLDQEGRVYLADFGIARMLEGGAAITRTGLVSGTPQYMAPEQATGQTLDHRMDIYALGIVAYEMFTGSTPFSADTPVAVLMKQVSSPIPIPPKEDVPEPLLGPLIKSLAKNPEERWQTAAALAAAFEKGLGSVTTAVGVAGVASAPTATMPARTPGPSPQPPPPPPVQGTRTTRVPSTVLPPRGGAAAPPRRTGSNALALWLVLGLGSLVVAGAGLAFWLWQRSPDQVDPRMVVEASPSPAATPIEPVRPPAPVATPEAAGATPYPSAVATPTPVSATPLPPSATTTLPRPTRPTPEAHVASTPTVTTVAAAAVPTVEPTPVPVTTTLPAPPATTLAAGHPFHLLNKIDVGLQVGPVTLTSAVFKSTRADELEVQLDFMCQKGKDQMVTYELLVRDAAGATLLTVRGRKGVEEKDKVSAKSKEHVGPGFFDTARSFTVSFLSVPD